MDIRCLKFMLILALVEQVRGFPLACPYNGTSYKEGERVKTEEPCLSCVCQRGALECSLRVCAEYPNALPPTCFLVHKPNDCCPQIFCEERFSPTGVEFRTGFKLETRPHGNDCVINGSVYAEGSAVASSRVCEYCYCVEGEMKCIKPRCLRTFEGCKAVYEKSSCCPTHYDCRDADVDYLTIQIKSFAKVNPAVSSESLRSLSSSDEADDNESEDTETVTDEAEKTTTEVTNLEETTTELEKESTVPLTSLDRLTTLSFQITSKSQNFNKETTKAASAEVTTFEPEKDVKVSSSSEQESQKETLSVLTRSKMDFQDGVENSGENRDNSSSQEVDDYDSYDYSEPRLPPSLPNLVIYPFVAADAVVKDTSADMSAAFEKVGIERIDAHPVFYKDYFSPPLKTEGGFVPKEPSKPDERFYEYPNYSREQIEPPSSDLTENPGISPVTPNGTCISDGREIQHREILSTTRDCVTCTCQHGAILCQDVECPQRKPERNVLENQKVTSGSILASVSNVAPDPGRLVGEALYPDTGTVPDFLLKDETTKFHEIHQTKKPVTVTYKNFAVDFYPNYLITTTRGHLKLQSVENTAPGEGLQHSVQETTVSLTTTRRPPFSFFDEADTSITTREISVEETTITPVTTTPMTTRKTYFFDEFIKSFLPKEENPDLATSTVSATAKHKYSSKIKGQINTTAKPKQEEFRERIQGEEHQEGKINSTTDTYYPWLNSITKPENVTEKTKNYSVVRKPLKKGNITQLNKTPYKQLSESLKPVETNIEKVELSGTAAEANTTGKNRKGEGADSKGGGALLKLAGCNIYGMMYRVGKIITELSGPCLECLCTELGVQCKPLRC